MRLLRLDTTTQTWRLEDFAGQFVPFYAVLSHRWGSNEDEVKFEDIQDGKRMFDDRSKPGYDKLRFSYDQVMRSGLRYFWIDTCCIKKTDSSELARSLNSMFYWYQRAAICYVYLSDVSIDDTTAAPGAFKWAYALAKSKWFTRGWTLQELLAPSSVAFFTKEGHLIGNKKDEMLARVIANVAGVPTPALRGVPLSRFSIETRRTWAARRTTTVPEDTAYCLMGIFDVQIPMLYADGEYHKRQKVALAELDRAIMNATVDTTEDILCIGGASWSDLSRLGQRQLEALDADLEIFQKWLIDVGVPLKIVGTKMRLLLVKYEVSYDEISTRAGRVQDLMEAWERYEDTAIGPQMRVRAFVENRILFAENHEALYSCITAAWTLEELMVWRKKWTR
jgi:hypothetical protein